MPDVPYGYCHCGCGEKTRLVPHNNARDGDIKGEPYRFIRGHHARVQPSAQGPDYVVDETTGCWIWQRRRHQDYGYGQLVRDGEYYAHRWYYIQHKGPIPEGLTLDHLCRNKACVNPDHLEPVTQAENKRRGAKLTAEEVQWIRAHPGPLKDIAERFGISVAYASQVRSGLYPVWMRTHDPESL